MSQTTHAKQANGQFQFTFNIPANEIEVAYQEALKDIAKNVEVPGFRKGKAPLNKVEEKVDSTQVYEQVIQKIIPDLYAKAIEEHKLRPIVHPQIHLVKAQAHEDWEVRATAAEAPKVDLKDSLTKIKGYLKSSTIWTPDKQAESKEDKPQEPTEEEKMQKVVEFMLKEVELEIAPLIVEHESNRSIANLVDQLEKLGVTLDQYLESTGKKAEDLRAEYFKRANEDLKMEFMLAEISLKEKIDVPQSEIDELINNAPDEQTKKALSSPQAQMNIRANLIKRKTLQHLLNLAS